jgi:hypothetical protein
MVPFQGSTGSTREQAAAFSKACETQKDQFEPVGESKLDQSVTVGFYSGEDQEYYLLANGSSQAALAMGSGMTMQAIAQEATKNSQLKFTLAWTPLEKKAVFSQVVMPPFLGLAMVSVMLTMASSIESCYEDLR